MKTVKTNLLNLMPMALLSTAVFTLTSCSSPEPSGGSDTSPSTVGTSSASTMYEKGVPGTTVVQTHKLSATVTGIDPATRKITLVDSDGGRATVKVGPDVVNFDQIRVGDQLKITATDQLVVKLADPGATMDDGTGSMVALAPVGAKPGALTAETTQVTAEVIEIDAKKHRATLRFPDGTTRSFPVRKDVDLAQRKVGDRVTIRLTEAVAIQIEKP